MKNNRRNFLKMAGITGIGVAGAGVLSSFTNPPELPTDQGPSANIDSRDENAQSIIGLYGPWAASLMDDKIPAFSFRHEKWQKVGKWKKAAKQRLLEQLAKPDIGGVPEVTVKKTYKYDGLHIEELSWQLPYGRPTAAVLLKPENASGPLPAILAFHDHGGNKYFGNQKIANTSARRHPVIEAHQKEYYDDLAWANEIAKRGYVVLVADAFLFSSRRVLLEDVPPQVRKGLNDNNPDDPANIKAYNNWAGEHEHVMAKSLFSAGTTWPGVFLAEDQKALDVLCARPDVDANRIGCGGLSGGGIRTVFMGGVDPRIKCAVCMGFMTTWRDLILHKSYTHTWMSFVPATPKDLDFPEILGLRAPLPTLVLNNIEDGLFTLSEMKASDDILAAVYKKAGAEKNYKCTFYPGIHKFDRSMQKDAFDWFDQWLKG